MTKKNRNKIYSEKDFHEAAQQFQAEARAATGAGGQDRPRFIGFRIVDDVIAIHDRACDQFEAGKFRDATELMEEALASLVYRQRYFFRHSLEVCFEPEINGAREAGVPKDLLTQMESAVETIRLHVRSDSAGNFDLVRASELYWRVEDTFNRVNDEHWTRKKKTEERELELEKQRRQKQRENQLQQRRDISNSLRVKLQEICA